MDRPTPPPQAPPGAGEDRGAVPRLVRQLGQRKFCQWLLAYVALAFMGLQMIDALADVWLWPLGFQRAATLVLGLGLLPAAVVAFFHGEQGRQRVCGLEMALLCLAAAASAIVLWRVFA